MKYKSGEEFLNKMYSKMYLEETVSNHANNGSTPTEIIKNYLDRLEELHNIAKQNDAKLQILKEFYYKKYIIKELPENYINLQEISGHTHFDRLPKAKGLNNLIRIGKAADFGFLNNAEGLNNLEYIGDFAHFDSLYCGDGLDNLRIIGGFANFRNMVYIRSYGNAKGLNKLQSIGGYALFENLISSQGLNNLLIVGGNLIVSFLRDYSGFSNLVSVNGSDANIFFETHGIRK